MQSHKFQINESHLGTDANATDAEAFAKILTAMGYESEYNPMQGVTTGYQTNNGSAVNIPDSVWAIAMTQLFATA
jgi:hypothetical protein